MKTRAPILALALLLLDCGVEVDTPPLPQPIKEEPCSLFGAGRKPIAESILNKLTTCCDGQGALAPAMLVPEAFASVLEKGPKQTLCVPRVFALDVTYKPPPCDTFWGKNTGACITTCIPIVQSLYGKYPQSNCGPREVCVPTANEVIDLIEGLVCGYNIPDGGAASSDGGLAPDAGPKKL